MTSKDTVTRSGKISRSLINDARAAKSRMTLIWPTSNFDKSFYFHMMTVSPRINVHALISENQLF